MQLPQDLSFIRGFNYAPASALGYTGQEPHYRSMWLNYDPAETDFNLDLAKRLNLNQTRVMMSYVAWSTDKTAFAKNVVHFVESCHRRDIGVMISVTYNEEPGWGNGSRADAKQYAADLVRVLKDEPGVIMWDVANEPDLKEERRPARSGAPTEYDAARYMAELFHELDHATPVTIGTAYVPGMEQLADCVDVLQFHDYSSTRARIRANIARAKRFAAEAGKPVLNGEIGCVARANPYDIALQEHMSAGVGWYIWELMIVRKGWGTIHGVFYEDGTVRDPALVAALLGCFRNRSSGILPTVPDQEGWVTRVVSDAMDWLGRPDATPDQGLDLAEEAANLLESAQLVAMREPPTRRVELFRLNRPGMADLRHLLRQYIEILEPYRSKES